ncbi:sigma-70 family RNA polymerase sigma factor [Magnetospirillum gryphiswaldense]|uniref:RNA polymerase sigma factor n=1 Tax=Magnetospirillum gryphiswaldense TaxID=55518 RepID=A4U152_9PROT|nr:sigma-70 family RNA polymerase sigma factor [Magnetospirillum gryphiswaldense]CAM76609.1 RNA polymerase sigma-70 factor, ECF [Magnetospirillum gryphiswaldense MSR-1]
MVQDEAITPENHVLSHWLLCVGRDRDRQAFAKLFQHYAPRLKTYMRKLGSDGAVADDLVQEAMLTVWRKAEVFDPAKASAGTWIFTIARNLRIDRFRREGRPEVDPADPLLVVDDRAGADDALATRQSGDRLRQALHTLPGDQAKVVELSFYEECPHVEIADRLGIPLGTVKSRLRLAMSRLRAALGDDVR